MDNCIHVSMVNAPTWLKPNVVLSSSLLSLLTLRVPFRVRFLRVFCSPSSRSKLSFVTGSDSPCSSRPVSLRHSAGAYSSCQNVRISCYSSKQYFWLYGILQI